MRREGRKLGQGLKLGDGLLVALGRQALQVDPVRRGVLALSYGGGEGELRLGEGQEVFDELCVKLLRSPLASAT